MTDEPRLPAKVLCRIFVSLMPHKIRSIGIARLYIAIAITNPLAALLFASLRASRQATPNPIKAIPATCAIVTATGVSRDDPIRV